MAANRRKLLIVCLAAAIVYLLYNPAHSRRRLRSPDSFPEWPDWAVNSDPWHLKLGWANIPEKYPVQDRAHLPPPSVPKVSIPKIQAQKFPLKDDAAKRVQRERLEAVKGNFTHAWRGYRKYAWMKDEIAPVTGGYYETFGGWSATLVDSLATLWIMGMKDEFEKAVEAVDDIDFSKCALDEINLFETTIRYLGGFLSAYDLTSGAYPSLLYKAVDLGEMLYHAFDTPNRMPVTRWNVQQALLGGEQRASDYTLAAEIGSLTLEFTRLSQLTGDDKFYDAVQRVMATFEKQQNQTHLPGMWPIVVNARDSNFTEYFGFTIGGMADSLYEYLPKQYLMLGGASKQYQRLYETALKTMKQYIFYRPMTTNDYNVLLAGQVNSDGTTSLDKLTTEPQAQHLACFAGGMVGLGAKIFSQDEEMETARKLVEGCLWGYETAKQGIMPEIIHTVACGDRDDCPWDEDAWHSAVVKDADIYESLEDLKKRLPPGVTKVDDPRYILRPEVVESVFYLYRITGDPTLQDRAWNMFTNITRASTTPIAHAALIDCTVPNPEHDDAMESFWLSETLRYFYLLFSEPDVMSLDDWVFNTEAHPLKRPSEELVGPKMEEQSATA